MSAVIAVACEMPARIECQCASIMPGINVPQTKSMTSASETVSAAPIISLMRPSCTNTSRPSIKALPTPSQQRAFFNRIGLPEDWANAMPLRPAAGATRLAAIPFKIDRRDKPFSIRANNFWLTGLQHAQGKNGVARRDPIRFSNNAKVLLIEFRRNAILRPYGHHWLRQPVSRRKDACIILSRKLDQGQTYWESGLIYRHRSEERRVGK